MRPLLAIATFLEGLNEVPGQSFEETGRLFLRGVSVLVGGVNAYLVIARQLPERAGGFPGGWHVITLFHEVPDPKRDEIVAEYLASGNAAIDPRTLAQVAGAGRDRAYLRRDLVPDEVWESSVSRRLDLALGLHDSMHGAVPVASDTEVYVAVHRPAAAKPFDEQDRELLLALLVAGRPILRRGVKGLGLIEGEGSLTPRQRAILGLLLTGASEKEIANRMGIAVSTVHQHVVTIYRVFRVRSRPELMAIWTGRGPDQGG